MVVLLAFSSIPSLGFLKIATLRIQNTITITVDTFRSLGHWNLSVKDEVQCEDELIEANRLLDLTTMASCSLSCQLSVSFEDLGRTSEGSSLDISQYSITFPNRMSLR